MSVKGFVKGFIISGEIGFYLFSMHMYTAGESESENGSGYLTMRATEYLNERPLVISNSGIHSHLCINHNIGYKLFVLKT